MRIRLNVFLFVPPPGILLFIFGCVSFVLSEVIKTFPINLKRGERWGCRALNVKSECEI